MNHLPQCAGLALFVAIGLIAGILFDQITLGLVAGAATGFIVESTGRTRGDYR